MGLFSRLRNRSSNSVYSTVPTTVMTPATPDQLTYAQEWVTKNGDPFAPVLATVGASSDGDAPPWARS